MIDADLDSFATAFYVVIDDILKSHPELLPYRPRIGISPKISDADLIPMAVMQGLQGFVSEAMWLRYAAEHHHNIFPYMPSQSSYN